MKTCFKCKTEKPLTDFGKDKSRKDGLYGFCKICSRKLSYEAACRRRATPEGREAHRKTMQQWYAKPENRETALKAMRKYQTQHPNGRNARRKNDPLYKLIDGIRTLIVMVIKLQGFKKTTRTAAILGCSFEEFKAHIEKQFTEGMSWYNQGEWHFDHIKPISLAKTEAEVLALNHYTNFQPLWAADNIRKSNKYSEKLEVNFI